MPSQSVRVDVVAGVLSAMIAGSAAVAESRSFSVGSFDQIEASNGVRVEVVIGPSATVTAHGAPRALDALRIRATGGRLEVSWRRDENHDGPDFAATRVHVVAEQVSDIEAENGADVAVSGLDVAALELEATNGGTLTASGVCGRAELVARRGGAVHADALACEHVRARASLGGVVRGDASGTLDAGASFGGDIKVSGEPALVRRGRLLGGEVALR